MPDMLDNIDEFLGSLNLDPVKPSKPKEEPVKEEPASKAEPTSKIEPSNKTSLAFVEGDDPLDFFENSGLKPERNVPDIMKPWMKCHTFTLVKTVAEVDHIVDECIKKGFCSLDLETEGLDNRINWKPISDNSSVVKPETVHKIVGYCISHDGIEGFYIPVRHNPTDGGPNLNVPLEGVEAAISRLCHAAIPEGSPEDIEKDSLSYKCKKPKVVIAFWNAQFDQEFLYPVTGIDWWHPASFEDGMVACFVKNASDKRLGLKDKSKDLLLDQNGAPYEMIKLKELFFGTAKKIKFNTLAPDEPGVLRYTGSDAICTYKICTLPDIIPSCYEKHNFTYRLEKQTTQVVRGIERNRVLIVREMVQKTLSQQDARRKVLLEKIKRFASDQRQWSNLDPNSPKQLSEFLFGPAPKGMDITPKPETNEASGQYKTDGDTLNSLAKLPNAPSILKDIVEFREVEKFINTYLDGLANNLDENNELRFSFKQCGAASGRFSAPAGDPDHGYSGVPIHGIPGGSEIRRAFEARPGYAMIKADYAGEELRIAANVSGEPIWINEFLHGEGDLHSITARAFFGKQEVTKEERKAGKTANFALLYGGGPSAVMRATGCDQMEGRRRKQAFDKSVPIFARWIKGQHIKVKKDLGVFTAYGRWLSILDANSLDGAVRSACERYSTNYVVQGSGADILKIALVLLHKAFYRKKWLKNGGDDSVRMLLTVHDEVVFEIKYERVAEAMPIIVDLMEIPWKMPTQPPWKVPLVVEPLIGFNWASGYEVKRVADNYKPKESEVILNGFAYSTTRKPSTEKDQIVEIPDRNEVIDGKVFRIVDAPWITCYKSEVNISMPTPPIIKTTSPIVEAPPVMIETDPSENKPKEEIKEPEKTTKEVLGSLIEQSKTDEQQEPTTLPTDIFVLGINQLNEQTVEQVFSCVMGSLDVNGPRLHLTDIVGTTLIPPSSNIHIKKDKLLACIGTHNLILRKLK